MNQLAQMLGIFKQKPIGKENIVYENKIEEEEEVKPVYIIYYFIIIVKKIGN